MTKTQDKLKAEINRITDESIIEKVQIYIMGILTQQALEKSRKHHKKKCPVDISKTKIKREEDTKSAT